MFVLTATKQQSYHQYHILNSVFNFAVKNGIFQADSNMSIFPQLLIMEKVNGNETV